MPGVHGRGGVDVELDEEEGEVAVTVRVVNVVSEGEDVSRGTRVVEVVLGVEVARIEDTMVVRVVDGGAAGVGVTVTVIVMVTGSNC